MNANTRFFIFTAVAIGLVDIVKYLIDKKASPKIKGIFSDTAYDLGKIRHFFYRLFNKYQNLYCLNYDKKQKPLN